MSDGNRVLRLTISDVVSPSYFVAVATQFRRYWTASSRDRDPIFSGPSG